MGGVGGCGWVGWSVWAGGGHRRRNKAKTNKYPVVVQDIKSFLWFMLIQHNRTSTSDGVYF